jgi:hypothetical protein
MVLSQQSVVQFPSAPSECRLLWEGLSALGGMPSTGFLACQLSSLPPWPSKGRLQGLSKFVSVSLSCKGPGVEHQGLPVIIKKTEVRLKTGLPPAESWEPAKADSCLWKERKAGISCLPGGGQDSSPWRPETPVSHSKWSSLIVWVLYLCQVDGAIDSGSLSSSPFQSP